LTVGRCEEQKESPAKAQRKNAKVLDAVCFLRALLCVFAPLRETVFFYTLFESIKKG
jgi:hypothetical protein